MFIYTTLKNVFFIYFSFMVLRVLDKTKKQNKFHSSILVVNRPWIWFRTRFPIPIWARTSRNLFRIRLFEIRDFGLGFGQMPKNFVPFQRGIFGLTSPNPNIQYFPQPEENFGLGRILVFLREILDFGPFGPNANTDVYDFSLNFSIFIQSNSCHHKH